MLEAAGHLVTGCGPAHTSAGGSSPQRGGPPKTSLPGAATAAAAAAVKATSQLLAAVAQSGAARGGSARKSDAQSSDADPGADSPAIGGPCSPAAGATTSQVLGATAAASPVQGLLPVAQATALWLAAADRVLFPVSGVCKTHAATPETDVPLYSVSCRMPHMYQRLLQWFPALPDQSFEAAIASIPWA